MQAQVEINSFVETFSDQISGDSAVRAFGAMKETLEQTFQGFQDAKVVTLEVFLAKALGNYFRAKEAENENAMNSAKQVILQQISVLSQGKWKLDPSCLQKTLYKLAMDVTEKGGEKALK